MATTGVASQTVMEHICDTGLLNTAGSHAATNGSTQSLNRDRGGILAFFCTYTLVTFSGITESISGAMDGSRNVLRYFILRVQYSPIE